MVETVVTAALKLNVQFQIALEHSKEMFTRFSCKMSKRKASVGDPSTYPNYKRQKKVMSRSRALYPSRKTLLMSQSGNSKNVATLYTYPFPSKIKTRLKVLQNVGLISALTSSSALVYRPTPYFDVDPAVGGASFAGYTFYASQYNRYRVYGFRYKASFVNLESTSVLVSCQAIPNDGTPASGTATDFTEYAVENDWSQYAVCPPTTLS